MSESESEINAETIRAYRAAAGLSVSEAARELSRESPGTLPAVDSLVRMWKRWEAGTRPGRTYQPLLRALLATDRPMPMSAPATVDLTGDWWAAWQTYHLGREYTDPQQVRLRQVGNELRFWALQRGRPIEKGGYLWSGEMRLWDNEILMGWYAADDGSVRSKGTVYFVVHPHGQSMRGRWVGLSYDGDTMSGIGVMGRTKADTERVYREQLDKERERGTDR
jgi:hypothetical protein